MEIPDLQDFAREEFQSEVPGLVDPATLDLNMDEVPPVPTPNKPWPLPSEPLPRKIPLKQFGKIAAIALLLLGIFLGLIAGIRYLTDPYDHRILENVSIAGVNIGAMTKKEADAALEAQVNRCLATQDMVVSLPHGTIILPAEETGARLRTRAAVRAAYKLGRRTPKVDTLDGANYLKLDKDYIRQQLSAYAAKYETTKTQYTYRMLGSQPPLEEENFDPSAACQILSITLGNPGFGLNMEDIYNRILTAYGQNQFQVTVDEIDPSALPDPVDLEGLQNRYFIAPVDAALDMENYCPIPGKYGYIFDLEKARAAIAAAQYGETVTIPMEYVEPEIQQTEVYFRDVLAQCKTPHATNENRNENLRIACASLNGKILQPGETLSYNDALGPRTKENGYKPAPAYSGTTLVDSYGGGICQVSSTLYYCAMLADLEIVSRINHGFAVGYIELGMDATVSMGGPDFVFRNNTNFPIQIEAWLQNGYVNLKILGTIEKDYYIQMTHQIIGRFDPGITYEQHGPEEGYYEGQLLQPGIAALQVESYRCKYDRETDALISREFEARSDYMSADKVVVQIIE